MEDTRISMTIGFTARGFDILEAYQQTYSIAQGRGTLDLTEVLDALLKSHAFAAGVP